VYGYGNLVWAFWVYWMGTTMEKMKLREGGKLSGRRYRIAGRVV